MVVPDPIVLPLQVIETDTDRLNGLYKATDWLFPAVTSPGVDEIYGYAYVVAPWSEAQVSNPFALAFILIT